MILPSDSSPTYFFPLSFTFFTQKHSLMKNHSQSIADLMRSDELLTQKESAQVKGGRRFVTKSYSAFAAKRSKLQNQKACMCITHIGDTYCIEW